MSNQVLDTRSKILKVAIDIVGLKGEVTIRELTEQAGVNVAAINYHFGNKNNLLKEVENYYSDLLCSMQKNILVNSELSSQEKLIQWAKSLLEFMFKFPALIELIVNISTEDKSYNPMLIQRIYLNEEIRKIIEEIIKENIGTEDNRLIKYKYLQIFSGIVGLVVNHVILDTYIEGKNEMDLNGSEELNQYVELLINSILTKSV
ncbi:TetR/AcrR family transcriptional regulator [Clostridium tunisiense]|uniref:TetR/AcrR family transcriptional regulator n=1 Tax=Clostridium tunisiense TaxID=219748 RepID=UPI0002D41F21|nr:TetR/AcrR family transcriptional regulator [Clostridium tunisiense]